MSAVIHVIQFDIITIKNMSHYSFSPSCVVAILFYQHLGLLVHLYVAYNIEEISFCSLYCY